VGVRNEMNPEHQRGDPARPAANVCLTPAGVSADYGRICTTGLRKSYPLRAYPRLAASRNSSIHVIGTVDKVYRRQYKDEDVENDLITGR
jgi:hypothetical protein